MAEDHSAEEARAADGDDRLAVRFAFGHYDFRSFRSRMRRFALGCTSLLLLVSCAETTVLKPEEVLRRANAEMHNLSSARFTASVSVAGSGRMLKLNFENGVFRGGGDIWTFLLREDGSGFDGKGSKSHLVANVTAINGAEYDIRPAQLSFSPLDASGSQSVRKLIGSWWRLPQQGGRAGDAVMTSDAQLMQLQSRSSRVTRDLGNVELGGARTHHYAVRLDDENVLETLRTSAERSGEVFDADKAQALLKRSQVQGEVWIDTDTFFIRRILWKITPTDSSDRSAYTSRLQVDLSDRNSAPDIALPQNVQVLPSSFVAHLPPSFSAMMAGDHFSSASPSDPFLP